MSLCTIFSFILDLSYGSSGGLFSTAITIVITTGSTTVITNEITNAISFVITIVILFVIMVENGPPELSYSAQWSVTNLVSMSFYVLVTVQLAG